MAVRSAKASSKRRKRTRKSARAKLKPSIRVFGDSNAVGYRDGPGGTKGCLEGLLKKTFASQPAFGRTRLTVAPSSFEFLEWSRERSRDLASTDYAVIVLGTNDITLLKRQEMPWSENLPLSKIKEHVRKHFRTVLAWVGRYAAERLFVVEPVNEMASRSEMRDVVVAAMRDEVHDFPRASWISMGWRDEDLQREGGGSGDPRHFNRAGARRIVTAVERSLQQRRRGAPEVEAEGHSEELETQIAPKCSLSQSSCETKYVQLVRMAIPGHKLPEHAAVVLRTLAKIGCVSTFDALADQLVSNGLSSVQTPRIVLNTHLLWKEPVLVEKGYVKLIRKPEPGQRCKLPIYVKFVKRPPKRVRIPPQARVILKALGRAGGICEARRLTAMLKANGLKTKQKNGSKKVFYRYVTSKAVHWGMLVKEGYLRLLQGRLQEL